MFKPGSLFRTAQRQFLHRIITQIEDPQQFPAFRQSAMQHHTPLIFIQDIRKLFAVKTFQQIQQPEFAGFRRPAPENRKMIGGRADRTAERIAENHCTRCRLFNIRRAVERCISQPGDDFRRRIFNRQERYIRIFRGGIQLFAVCGKFPVETKILHFGIHSQFRSKSAPDQLNCRRTIQQKPAAQQLPELFIGETADGVRTGNSVNAVLIQPERCLERDAVNSQQMCYPVFIGPTVLA